jgi:hypothetical protein
LETEDIALRLTVRSSRSKGFVYTKVRYRGMLKNALHLNTLCMLASLYLKRRVLAAARG